MESKMCHFREQFHFTACVLVSATLQLCLPYRNWWNISLTHADLMQKHFCSEWKARCTSNSILKQEKSKWWMQYFEEMDNILRGVISSLRVEEWRIRKSNSFGMLSIIHLLLFEIGWILFARSLIMAQCSKVSYRPKDCLMSIDWKLLVEFE